MSLSQRDTAMEDASAIPVPQFTTDGMTPTPTDITAGGNPTQFNITNAGGNPTPKTGGNPAQNITMYAGGNNTPNYTQACMQVCMAHLCSALPNYSTSAVVRERAHI